MSTGDPGAPPADSRNPFQVDMHLDSGLMGPAQADDGSSASDDVSQPAKPASSSTMEDALASSTSNDDFSNQPAPAPVADTPKQERTFANAMDALDAASSAADSSQKKPAAAPIVSDQPESASERMERMMGRRMGLLQKKVAKHQSHLISIKLFRSEKGW